MQFRTQINLKPQQNIIDYKSNVLLVGSCFTQNIGDKLSYYKFKNTINPFGILFNPKAIENLIVSALENRIYTKNELVFNNERWHCFDSHSDFSNEDKKEVLATINSALKQTKKQLKTVSHIIITLGTSWVYRYNKTDDLVGNCHKISQKEFTKELLSVDEIVSSLENIINSVKAINKNVTVIFTLSPVRHLKDGFIENNLSKAHLLTAIDKVLDNDVNYFPAYEIMMDDLRDYRFYKKDMLHPNEIAVDYIWNKFVATWINTSEKETMEKVEQIQKGLAHKPFNENSKQHQKFVKNLKQKIKILENTKGIKINF